MWPYMVIFLDQTPTFEGWMARLAIKNGYKNDIC